MRLSAGAVFLTSLIVVVAIAAAVVEAQTYGAPPLQPGPKPLARPANAIDIVPGTDLATAISGQVNKVFWLKAGRHALNGKTVYPGTGTKIYGEYLGSGPGQQALVSGLRDLTGWQSNGGGVWFVSGQPTAPANNYVITDCSQLEAGWYGSAYPEDLIAFQGTNGVGVKRLRAKMTDGAGNDVCNGNVVESVASVLARCVTERGWFWDYPSGRIYIGFDPSSVSRLAVTTWPGSAGAAFASGYNEKWDGGLLQNVVLEGFAEAQGDCAVQLLETGGSYRAWPNGGFGGVTVQDCEIRYSTGAVYLGPASVARGNLVHHMSQNGFKAWGTNVLLELNEVHNINWRHMATQFEAGGTKFWKCTNLLCQKNLFHDIYGGGIWSDYGQEGVNIISNTVYNTGGIAVETTRSSVVAWNYVYNCSWDSQDPPWSGCGIFNYASSDTEIHHNLLIDNKGSVCIQTRERGYSGRNVSPEKPDRNLLTWNQADATDAEGTTYGFEAGVNCILASDAPGWVGTGQRASINTGSGVKTTVTKTRNAVLRMTSTGGASMIASTISGGYGKPHNCKIHENLNMMASARVRGSGTPRNCRVNLVIYDAFGVVLTTYNGAWQSNSVERELSVTGSSTADGVWAALQVEIQSVPSGESHWVDQLFIGSSSDWTNSGGWTISWGEKRTGVFNLSVHDNDVTYTTGKPGYTGLVIIPSDDYSPYQLMHPAWVRAVAASPTFSWQNNIYRSSDDPKFQVTAGTDNMWSDRGARFLWMFPTGWETSLTNTYTLANVRYISWAKWQSFGKDTTGMLALRGANVPSLPPTTQQPTTQPPQTPVSSTTVTSTTQNSPTTTQSSGGGGSCTGNWIYNNALSATGSSAWTYFPWASTVTLNAPAPAGAPTISNAMLWTTPDVNGGGIEFRTYSCPSTRNYQSFNLRVFPSAGTWSFTLKPHQCNTYATTCASDYVVVNNVPGGVWTTLSLPVRSACMDALPGLSGFEINYRWTGAAAPQTVYIGAIQMASSCTGGNPTTQQPTTQAPTTQAPTTQAPTTQAPPAVGGGSICTAPVWSASGNDAGWSVNGYYLHNNIWNAGAAGQGPQTTYGCSEKSWYTISTQNNVGDGSVKTYPNIHLDLPNAFTTGVPFNNYGSIWSTFAGVGPKTGIYNVAYDLWLNGVGWGNGHTEYMIWTENQGQTPLGTFDSTVTVSGYSWKAYHYNDGNANVVSLVAPTPIAAGVLDLKAFIQWGINKGWIPPNPSLNQFGFGVEIVSTNNQPLRFDFTDFSVQLSAGVVSPPTQTTTQPTTQQATTVSPTTTQAPPSSGGSCTGTTIYSTGSSVAAGWQNFFWGGSLAFGVANPVTSSGPGITSTMKLTTSSQWGGSLIFRTYQCPSMNGKRAFRVWLLPTGGGTWTFSFKPRSCSLATDYAVVCAANAVTVSLPGNNAWTAVELPVHSACLDALGGLSGFSIDFSNSGSAASSSTYIAEVKLVDTTCPVLRAAADSASTSSSSSSSSGLPVAAIVAIVAGCVALLAAIVVVVVLARRRRYASVDPSRLLDGYDR